MSSAEENPGTSARTPSARKEKRLWPLALLLMVFVLAGGGYYALTALKDTAHKMGTGSEYDQLAANSSIYDGNFRGDERAVFAGMPEGEAALASEKAQSARLNSSLIRSKDELVAAANSRGGGASGSYGGGGQGDEDISGGDAAPGAVPGAGNMGSKLKARASLGKGAGASRSKGLPAGNSEAFVGSASKIGKASVQRETADAKARKNNKGGVLESLKGAFRASFYGARSASNDAAKNWSARAFDAAEEAETAIEYDEQVKAKLDRVNPNSIPGFLRDQDVSAAEAKRLADSAVSDPKMDKDGTFDALKKDSDYQKQKLASDFAGSMINGLFAGVSGTGGGGEDEENSSARTFSDPDEEAEFSSLALGEYMDTAGFGGECGCTADAPCCCLPQDYFSSTAASQNDCPAYGPFLPDDPCNFDNNAEGAGTVGGI